jgi:ribonucleoside-diphosphate reductase alpha chain
MKKEKLQLSENALTVLQSRYLRRNEKGEIIETPETMFERVALTIAKVEKNYGKTDVEVEELAEKFYTLMGTGTFLPNSPTLMNAGREMGLLSACFVLPVEDNIESIFNSIKSTALIQKAGGGTGFDFSQLRPEGDIVRSSGGKTSGPLSFMRVFSEATNAIQQGSFRRGANMGILRIDHPDILKFIRVKQDLISLSNFNLSVAVTDEFMRLLKNQPNITHTVRNPRTGDVSELRDEKTGEFYTVKKLFDLICKCSYETGEPGVIFIDTINKHNPTPHLGPIRATNPCVTGDTLIFVADDRRAVPIKQLANEQRDVHVYSRSHSGDFSIKLGRSPRLTRVNASVFEVVFEGGFSFRATADHNLFLSSGQKCAVRDLKPGDRLGGFSQDALGDAVLLKDMAVSAVRSCGHEDVYNLTVDENHTYCIAFAQIGSINSLCGVVSSNCGEQPLLFWEACTLGAINLSKFVFKLGDLTQIDFEQLKDTVHAGVRFLDNVVEANRYPLKEIEDMCLGNRKIGLGVMGWADCLYKLGLSYNSDGALDLSEKIMKFIDDESHAASEALAKEKGSFPNWKGSRWETEHNRPMRNAATTTIAPTGTISIIAGCSSGIEPLFSLSFYRNVLDGKKMTETNQVFVEYAKDKKFYSEELCERLARGESLKDASGVPAEAGRLFVTAHDIKPLYHVRMQAVFQKYCDSSISKTINFSHDASFDSFEGIYQSAWELGCKGLTVYRDGCRKNQPMSTKSGPDAVMQKEHQLSALLEKHQITVSDNGHIVPLKTPEILSCIRIRQKSPFGNMHVKISVDAKTGKELEVFAQLGKGGDVANSDLEAICRIVSLFLRCHGPLQTVVGQLSGIGSSLSVPTQDGRVMSLGDGLAKALTKYLVAKKQFGLRSLLLGDLSEAEEVPEATKPSGKSDRNAAFKIVCPECGGTLTFEEGCLKCHSCAYSAC